MNNTKTKSSIKCISPILFFMLIVIGVNGQYEYSSSELEGPYLGQKPPGMTAELFAPGIVSTQYFEHSSPSFSPDGQMVVWSLYCPEDSPFPRPIVFMEIRNGFWTKPVVAPFLNSKDINENPFFSVDGNRIYYVSRPDIGARSDWSKADIFYVERNDYGWDKPQELPFPPNSENIDHQPSITKEGTVYFISYHKDAKHGYALYYSKLINDRYSVPVLLEPKLNNMGADWTPYISPDESYLVFSSDRKGGYGMGDLYISFRLPNGSWSYPVNLGPQINSDRNDRFPNVTPDGKYLFFNSTRFIEGAGPNDPGNGNGDIYWVSTKIIENIRKEALKDDE